jgi:GT2 family glycosyltransferase
MDIYISVISHHNTSNIMNLNCLPILAKLPFVHVVVKDNVNDPVLKTYCESHSLYYISSVRENGFGANNNEVFNFCESELGMTPKDGYLVMNPDVELLPDVLVRLKERAEVETIQFATGQLFVDRRMTVQDHSIRRFPKFKDFGKSFLIKESNYAIDFDNLSDLDNLDCCSGAFMFFKVAHYQSLGGFDERYYLYCEDFDLCRRSNRMGVPLVYLSDIKAVHLRQRRSRKAFSWYFWQHVRSVFLYSFLLK